MAHDNEEIARLIAQQEGDHPHCVPGDRGGWTSAGGITARYLSRREGIPLGDAEERVRAMSMQDAALILERDFVEPFGFADPPLRGPLASCAVNMGVGRAVKILQRAINGFPGDKLDTDGIAGPLTRAGVDRIGADQLAYAFCNEWLDRYQVIAIRRGQMKFYRGWRNRVAFWVDRLPNPGQTGARPA